MKIDAHVYVGESLYGCGHSPHQLIEALDAHGIDCALMCPVKPRGYHLEPENNMMTEIMARHRGRLIGFARVDPWRGTEALDEFSRAIESLRLRGLYLNPWEEKYPVNSEIVYPLMEKAKEYKVPVMIKGGYPIVSQPSQIADIAKSYPETIIIATSGGQINICGGALEDARLMLAENSNVYMETSGIYREDFIEEMISVLGAERLLYGSSSPEMEMGFEMQRIMKAHISDKDRKKIMGENLGRLLKL